MTLKIFHQVGHNANWNISSFEDDNCGDGLILSPLHQTMPSIEKMKADTKRESLFDPQFYLPSSRKPKLLSDPFFPESQGGGFQTGTFKAQAKTVAEGCLEFQRSQGFGRIVIPTRFIDQMYSDYIDRQKQFTVEAFMEAANTSDALCLSVALTDAMIQDPGFRTKVLNWITAYPTVESVLIMYQHNRDTKQIHDSAFLKSAIAFFSEILSTGLELIVGYTNTEGIILSTAGNLSLTMGAFENTRIFSIDKFIVSDEERRGPKARIYLDGLMNWVQFEDAKTIRRDAPGIWASAYKGTPYSEYALGLHIEPTFNQPQLYKHYFLNIEDLFSDLKKLAIADRKSFILEKLRRAEAAYRALESKGIYLEKHGRGGHISKWIEALS
jgi:hypothetical protein